MKKKVLLIVLAMILAIVFFRPMLEMASLLVVAMCFIGLVNLALSCA